MARTKLGATRRKWHAGHSSGGVHELAQEQRNGRMEPTVCETSLPIVCEPSLPSATRAGANRWRTVITNDYTSSGLERESCTVCDRAILKQPWMSAAEWVIASALFEDLHKNCEWALAAAATKPTV